jgi:DNA ligase (NAD+)
LSKASRDKLMSIEAIGPKIADSIRAFFEQEENQKIIQGLKEAGVKMAEEAKAEKQPLDGMEFVITGRLDAFSRQEAEEKIKALGGTAKDNVTKKTNYLVVGADPGGTKLAKAQELGTPQIDEKKLLGFLEGKSQ